VVKRGAELLSSVESREHAGATMLAPILKGVEVIGVLFIQNNLPGSYAPRDLELLPDARRPVWRSAGAGPHRVPKLRQSEQAVPRPV